PPPVIVPPGPPMPTQDPFPTPPPGFWVSLGNAYNSVNDALGNHMPIGWLAIVASLMASFFNYSKQPAVNPVAVPVPVIQQSQQPAVQAVDVQPEFRPEPIAPRVKATEEGPEAQPEPLDSGVLADVRNILDQAKADLADLKKQFA